MRRFFHNRHKKKQQKQQREAFVVSDKSESSQKPNISHSKDNNNNILGRFQLVNGRLKNNGSSNNKDRKSRILLCFSSRRMDSTPMQAQNNLFTPENVAAVPPPGLSGPSQVFFAPTSSRYLAFVSTTTSATPNSTRTARSASSSQTSTPSPSPSSSPYTCPYLPLTEAQGLNLNNDSNKGKKPSPSSVTSTATVSTTSTERVLLCVDLESDSKQAIPLLRWSGGTRGSSSNRSSSKRRMLESSAASSGTSSVALSLDERLRKERQRLSSSGSLTQFSWTMCTRKAPSSQISVKNGVIESRRDSSVTERESKNSHYRILIPARGNLYIQDGLPLETSETTDNVPFPNCTCIHDKGDGGMIATDAQLSPDGTMVAWTYDGEIYVQGISKNVENDGKMTDATQVKLHSSIRVTFGAVQNEEVFITHGVADFVAQEEMDRYHGFWWHPDSNAILFTQNDESQVPIYRIMHNHPDSDTSVGSLLSTNNSNHDSSYVSARHSSSSMFEDHRYPFAGKMNPKVRLGFVQINRDSVLNALSTSQKNDSSPNQPTDESRGDNEEVIARDDDPMQIELTSQEIAAKNWENCKWFDPPREATEYLARAYWLPDGRAVTQWQNRSQNCSVLYRLDLNRVNNEGPGFGASSPGRTMLVERSDVWINLHHLFKALERPIHPDECVCNLDNDNDVATPIMPNPLPEGSFSFVFASERTGFQHLYLYTYCPGINGEQAVLLRALTAGDWMVEHIIGIDMKNDLIYFTGTYDSVLERHLYTLPLLNRLEQQHENHYSKEQSATINANAQHTEDFTKSTNGTVRRGLSKVMHALSGGGKQNNTSQKRISMKSSAATPVRLTTESGMHSVVMDDNCRFFVDTSSDLDRPTTVKVFELLHERSDLFGTSTDSAPVMPEIIVRHDVTLFDASVEDKSVFSAKGSKPKLGSSDMLVKSLPAPELLSFPTSDGSETLHAAVYRPDPGRHGPGPYPLVCAVYGGPHVQRVNRSWAQSADMRAQRLRSLGFCVVKCDNRGSSRRGLKFESAISKRLGRVEVIDQVTAARQLTVRGIADPSRVGVYGWSYGGYLAAMCLCRAPDVFHVAVAGAPVTSWDGYDTHYTERYMGLPADNPAGYRESAVFDHVANMRGKLMIVHGLIDENVHFRHSTRLINRLIAAGKDYDLLVFPEERHSPRRLRDRIYMEQKISDYFIKHLAVNTNPTALDLVTSQSGVIPGIRTMAGHL